MNKSHFESVLKMSKELIALDRKDDKLPSLELITEKVDMVLAMPREWDVDRDTILRELRAQYDVWLGRDQALVATDENHEAWLNGERKIGWRYWPRYEQMMEGRLPPEAALSLDKVTDKIVGYLEDPNRSGAWDRRGLVVGNVQSGKTSNYCGVICKAADAGYKMIIVLAGMHNNLRSQTQMRLDEGFLGYKTRPIIEAEVEGLSEIGVGLLDPDPLIRPNYVTNRTDRGDFNRSVANNLGVTPDTRPWLLVIKKNGHILKNLVKWIEDRVADSHDSVTGRKIVTSLPLLVIDDEADHASVDTGDQPVDGNGTPDPDYEPRAINRRIRRLLHIFQKSAYIGYTATPFANIFIHEQARTTEEGEDLFPRSFIYNLPTPSNHIGPSAVFGLKGMADLDEVQELPLVRQVRDHADSLAYNEREGWVPPIHPNGHIPLYNGLDELPPSLKKAVLSFILTCAIRRARGQRNMHNSMLIHVTRYISVQQAVYRQVERYLEATKRRIIRGEGDTTGVMEKIKVLWQDDYKPTTAVVDSAVNFEEFSLPPWSIVERELKFAVADIEVREINGSAGDVLDYEQLGETGLNVIAIGGDKLSRGLTLEGLSVSYFLRATKMYDTLMQMGRWFGYRKGYLDLCRLFLSPELEKWFERITEASEELRFEFDHMEAIGGSPRDYGLKVRSHPLLMVTSPVKMRHSRTLQITFAGAAQETVLFDRSRDVLNSNFTAASNLVKTLGQATENSPVRERPFGGQHKWENTVLWNDVEGRHLVDFLHNYRTHPDAVRAKSDLLADYIEKQMAKGELTNWTVALMSGGQAEISIGSHRVNMIQRKVNERNMTLQEQKEDNRHIIRRVIAPRDEAIDLTSDQYEAALIMTRLEGKKGRENAKTPSGPAIRAVRGLGAGAFKSGIDHSKWHLPPHPERGLLLIYPLSPDAVEVELDKAIIGFGLSFPESTRATRISYRVTNLYWEQEYGA